ncbi:hypothetical protein D3C71_1748900 [compost metagenome]
MRLPRTVKKVGHRGIPPPEILPIIPPIADIKTIASEEAMVVRVGILRTVSIIGMRIKAPPAPTMPDTIPTSKAAVTAILLLNCIFTNCSSVPLLGTIIRITASTARIP